MTTFCKGDSFLAGALMQSVFLLYWSKADLFEELLGWVLRCRGAEDFGCLGSFSDLDGL